MIKICPICGKEFVLCKKHPNTTYCSRQCAGKARISKQKLICDFCGKVFYKPNSLIKGYKKHFCSDKCKTEANKKENKIFYEKDYAYMLLSKDNIVKKVLFDIDDVEKIQQYKWHLHLRKKDMRYDVCSNTYGKHSERKYIIMTRYIMDCPKHLVVDHINHNTLDNRKCNLRNVTVFENNRNKLPMTK